VHDGFLAQIPPDKFTADRALVHHESAVAEPQHFLHLTTGKKDDHPTRRQVIQEPVNILLGSDINASGGLIQQKNAGLKGEPFGKDDLLLVTPGEKLDQLAKVRGFNMQLASHPLCQSRFCVPLAEARPRQARQAGQSYIALHGHFQDHSLLLTIFGHQSQTRSDGGLRGTNRDGLAVYQNLAANGPVDAKKHA
jgi:hypothetical protein